MRLLSFAVSQMMIIFFSREHENPQNKFTFDALANESRVGLNALAARAIETIETLFLLFLVARLERASSNSRKQLRNDLTAGYKFHTQKAKCNLQSQCVRLTCVVFHSLPASPTVMQRGAGSCKHKCNYAFNWQVVYVAQHSLHHFSSTTHSRPLKRKIFFPKKKL